MRVQELLGLTGCLDDVVCSANGSRTPGLSSQLAYSATSRIAFQHAQALGRFQQLPSFRSSISFRAGQPVPTFHPHYLSVYASTLNFGLHLIATLQHSILSLWLRVTQAGSSPARLQTISSPHVATLGSSCSELARVWEVGRLFDQTLVRDDAVRHQCGIHHFLVGRPTDDGSPVSLLLSD